MNWSLFFDLTVSGLTLGSVYALIALGYSMVYGILKLLNFAHRPLRNAPRIAPLISALGVSFFLQNSALLLFGASFRDYDTFELIGVKTYNVGANLFFSVPQLLTFIASIALMVVLTLLVARTRIGKAMRATSFDREAAAMMGIDVDRVIAATFFIGSALAGAAGVMFGLVFGQIYHFMGFLAGLKGFTAAVIGGIGSIPGAMLGGLLVGLAESYATGYLPQGSTFKNLYVFSLLIVVILVRPSGLLGRADIKKV